VKKEYFYTLVTAGMSMVASLSLYKMSSYLFGTIGFAEFSLIRRVIAFMVPLFALGIGVGLPREVARINGTKNDDQKYILLKYGLAIVLAPMIAFFVLIVAIPERVALIIFSDKSYSYLLLPVGLFLFGNLINALSYAYFRGLDRIAISNNLQIINMMLVPVIIMAFFSDNVASFLRISGIVILIISLGFLLPHIRKKYRVRDTKILTGLFSYSIRRVPGDISLELLFVIPAILTAHLAGVEQAGKVSFGLAILTIATAPLSPVSVLLLPKSMKFFNNGNLAKLKSMINFMLRFVLVTYFIISFFMFFGADFLVSLFLDNDQLTSFIIKVISLSIMPYSIYILLRSIVDAGSRRAYNSFNCFIALLMFTLVFAIGVGYFEIITSMIFSIIVALYFLGILTYLRARFIVLLS